MNLENGLDLRRHCHRPSGRGYGVFHLPAAAHRTYHAWRKLAPDWLLVQPIFLPGRERRIGEPAFSDMNSLIDNAVRTLGPAMGNDVILFGYSMGALVAFEIARAMRRLGFPRPRHLFAAAHRAPQLADSFPAIHDLSNNDLKRAVKERFGEFNAALDHPDLGELLLPPLRADLSVCSTYRYEDGPPLDCPISVAGGTLDKVVSASLLPAWKEQTSGKYSIQTFDGGHFFLQDKLAEVLAWVVGELENSPTGVSR